MTNIGNFNPSGAVPASQSDASAKSKVQDTKKIAPSDSVSQKSDKTTPQPVSSRVLSESDLRQTLLSLQKPVTQETMQILMTMLMHGIEASVEAFEMIEQFTKFTKGKSKGNKLEATAIAYSKGLEGNSKAIDLIASFLSQNVQLTKKMSEFNSQLAKLRSGIGGFSNQLDPALIAGLSGFLDDFLEEMKLLKKHSSELDYKAMFSMQSGLIQDLKYLQEFLRGVEGKVGQEGVFGAELKKLLNKTLEHSSSLHDSLLTQLVLSKTPKNHQLAQEFFHYWMIPNPMAQALRDVELLISKDPVNKKKINPDKTKIVIKCETTSLGDLTIIIELNDKKMAYKIYSNKEVTQKFVVDYTPDLRKSMEALSYEVISVRTLKKHINLKKLLIPTLDLNNIKRINTEV